MSHITRRLVLGAGAAMPAAAVLGAAGLAQADIYTPTQYADYVLARLSTADKISQLFIGQLYGTSLTAANSRNRELYGVGRPIDVVRRLRFGGFALTPQTGQFRSAQHVLDWTSGLQAAAQIPLQIAVTGRTTQLANLGIPVTDFPPAMAMGAWRGRFPGWGLFDAPFVELEAMGLNTYLGVCAELASPQRGGLHAYGADPDIVRARLNITLGGAGRGAMVRAGVGAFPGADDAPEVALASMRRTRAEWDQAEAILWRSLARGTEAPHIVVGHIVAPHLDSSGVPASLSAPIVTGILRDEFRYGGVIVTDALTSPALRERFDDGELAVRALEAGVDQLLMSAAPRRAHAAVSEAVRSGRISASELDAKVHRVLQKKFKIEQIGKGIGAVGSQYHRRDALRVTRGAITVVAHDGTAAFVAGARVVVTGIAGVATTVGALLREAGIDAAVMPDGNAAAIAQAEADAVLVLADSEAHPGHAALVEAAHAAGRRVVAVAVGTPYELAQYPAHVKVCTFGSGSQMPECLVDVLVGRAAPQGKLPVPVSGPHGDFPLDTGLTWQV